MRPFETIESDVLIYNRDVALPVQFDVEPYNGFNFAETYQSIACHSSVIDGILNGRLTEDIVRSCASFRVDLSAGKGASLDNAQKGIASLVLRMLCRGTITKNTAFVEREIDECIPGECFYTNSDFQGSRLLTNFSPTYPFDGDREEFFAQTVLKQVIGPHWPVFTNSQVFLQTIGERIETDPGFAGQRVDFLISNGAEDIVIELDGEEHIHQIEKDTQRDAFLQRNGFKVIRIPNEYLDTSPERVINNLKEEFEFSLTTTDSNSVSQKRIVAAKLIHQIQIAVAVGLIHDALPTKGCIGISAELAGFSKSQIHRLLAVALKDLSDLFENFCALYQVPAFFSLFCGEDSCDAMICVGTPVFSAPSSVVITDITTSRVIENRIPSWSGLLTLSPDDVTLRFFLEYVFHFNKFREGQQAAIERLLRGQDTIVLLPTGSGKSLIYQLASLICPGKIIIISPLVSLMQDQLDNLKCKGISCAVSVSKDNNRALSEINNPGITMIYISPERLQIKGFRDCVNTMQSSNRVFAVAVDEAHCVSEWGHDFRTSYLNIGRSSRLIFNHGGTVPTIIALTGTASTAVLKDVKRELEITQYDAIITPETFDRKELHYKVVKSDSDKKKEELVALFDRVIPDYFHSAPGTFFRLRDSSSNCGIVFCPHVNGDYGVKKVQSYLFNTMALTDIYSGSAPRGFRGNWDTRKRNSANSFKGNRVNTLVATKAFGMGIDKPNVRFTVHYGIPSSLESFYQEAGRAGRDGSNSLCVIILSLDNARMDDHILNPTTPLEDVREYIDAQTIRQQDDVSRSLWFHNNAFRGISFELSQVEKVIDVLFREDRLSSDKVSIGFGKSNEDNSQQNVLKATQRLLVLGVVSDYTVDYSGNAIQITPGSADFNAIRERYGVYVKGYNEGRVARELEKLDIATDCSTKEYILNAARVLTTFIYDTIEKGRRRGLREIVSAVNASMASLDPDTTLRQRIVRYLESTYSEELNDILESKHYGFEKIPAIIDGVQDEDDGEVRGGIRSANEAAGLRGGVSRYLESTPDHPGLLALRALAELYCKDYNPNAVKDDFVAACSFAVSRYSYSTEDLTTFVRYFLTKAIERAPALFQPLLFSVKDYVDSDQMCIELMDSDLLTENEKRIPAIVFFSAKARHSLSLINKIKGE